MADEVQKKVIEELVQKLNDKSDRFNLDPDTYGGSESEYQYATGKSEAYSEAAYMVSQLAKGITQ